MATLQFTDYLILAADLGSDNMMPDIKNVDYIHAGFTLTSKVRADDAENLGKGMINTMLPYSIQDNYNRNRALRTFKAAILENDVLRAVFLPELGGRLWSLYHKKLERELLYVNPVFQPGNLALRNAWFSGGIEWNIGIKGHNPLTCSPMFACSLSDPQGNAVLRMYEFERIRGICYSMDFLLPEGSDILYMRTTVENTTDSDKWMYWWTNIAVPENPGTRVIAPCREAFLSSYHENAYVVDMVDIPVPADRGGLDITYPTNVHRSQDYFFRLDKTQPKWITAVEENGIGLLEFSSQELIGRKMFLWGQGQGGKNWSQWLSGEPKPYIELQAGLARTQLEHITMPAHTTWSWVEGFTAVVFEPQTIHSDYEKAVQVIDHHVNNVLPDPEKIRTLFDSLGSKVLVQQGSGWGYVENMLRRINGQHPVSRHLCFPFDSVGPQEQIWLDFLRTGEMTLHDLDTPPQSYHTDPAWIPLFEAQIRSGKGNAYCFLQYGVTMYANGHITEAYDAFMQSFKLRPNAWAARNLSMLEKNELHSAAHALEWMEQAIAINQSDRGLIVNCAQVMLHIKAYHRWLEFFGTLTPDLQNDSRLLLYKAIALIELGKYQSACEIINPSFVLCDIKEGEVSLSHIWEDLYQKLISERTGIMDTDLLRELQQREYPLPAHLDFRMDQ